MTNREHFKEKIGLLGKYKAPFACTLDGRIVPCNTIRTCTQCIFQTSDDCDFERIAWLDREYDERLYNAKSTDIDKK